MASVEDVDRILGTLLRRLQTADPATRAVLPTRRVIEASCPDLDLVRYAVWADGRITLLDDEPDGRVDIRISVHSDDLLDLESGALSFGQAYASNRVRLDASITDLLRLRTML